jgi:hypothetical protein
LSRRIGYFDAFLQDLIARTEVGRSGDRQLSTMWDIEGDPHASLIARLWAFVAEGVAAYTELTASEAYLPTAYDWTDVRRLARLVGFKPRPRIAAQGWVRVDVDRGANPVAPRGSRMQAPATPQRSAQTFETIADTQLHSDWGQLHVTPVVEPADPLTNELRLLADPGFRAGDRLLLTFESLAPPPHGVLGVCAIAGRRDDFGTTVLELDTKVPPATTAYRIVTEGLSARRLTSVLRIPQTGNAAVNVSLPAYTKVAFDKECIVLDAPMEEASVGRSIAIVDWTTPGGAFQVVEIASSQPIDWEVSPGATAPATLVRFIGDLDWLANSSGPISAYVVDGLIDVFHSDFTQPPTSGAVEMRLYPAPKVVPDHVALEVSDGEWEVFACTANLADLPTQAGGVVVRLDRAPSGGRDRWPATANIVRVRHGTTENAVLGSGDATQIGQRMPVPDAPVAYDLNDVGEPVPSLVLRVDGVQWEEVDSLYGAGPLEAFVGHLDVDGGVTAEAGDGVRGSRLPTGKNNVIATYRVGGGTEGEVESGAISSLVGSIRGVKKVAGAGPTSGGADQDDEARIRRLAPARARAFGRAISRDDLVDLALGYAGVSHAVAWHGEGPTGCGCERIGLHLAFLRTGAEGIKVPSDAEVDSLAGFLDHRRDAAQPLCVCKGVRTFVSLSAVLAVDPRRIAASVVTEADVALADPEGPLAASSRSMGQTLDRSDVFAVLQRVPGVIGVNTLTLGGATGQLGRRIAERYELLLLSSLTTLSGAST